MEEPRNNTQIQNNNKQQQTNKIPKTNRQHTKKQKQVKKKKKTPTINDWYGIDTCDEDLEFCSRAGVCVLKRATLFLIICRQENMKLETCTVSLPPHLGGDVGDLWTADRVPCCLRWQPGHGHANLWRQEEEEDEREEAKRARGG